MHDELELIEQAVAGNQQAFASLVERYKNYVFSILLTMLKNRMDAEEAAQDSFIKIYKALGKYESRSKFSSWIYSIAYRTGLDYLRKRRPTEDLDVAVSSGKAIDESQNPVRRLEYMDKQASVANLIDTLDPADASLLRMYYFEDMSIKELAVLTELNESNIKVKLYRLRGTLRKKMEETNFITE